MRQAVQKMHEIQCSDENNALFQLSDERAKP